MPARTKEETTGAEAGLSPVPGKPISQVEAEAPPDAETAAAWQAEYESRMPDISGEPAEAPAEEPAEEDHPAHRAARHQAHELYAPAVSLMSRRGGYPSRERITKW